MNFEDQSINAHPDHGAGRILIENMLEGYAYCRMVYDGEIPVDCVFLEVNPSFERLTGLKDVEGRNVSSAVPDARSKHPELFMLCADVASTGKARRTETFYRPMGLWLSISAYSSRKDHFIAIFDDISSRKNAEQQLADSLEYSQKIFDTSPVGITTYRATGEVVSSNQAAANIAGASIEQLNSQNFRTLETWKHSGLLEAADSALATMKETRIEIHATSSFGRDVWLYARFVPFTHMAETRLLFITEDVAERKRAERLLHDATVEREQLVRKELQAALDNVKLLQGLLPICSNCKKIRDSDGVWSPVETYLIKHSEASFTHGVCPNCVKLLYGDVPDSKA